MFKEKSDQRAQRLHFRDGIDEGRLCSVCITFSTSLLLSSGSTFPGTESNTQSCSASGEYKLAYEFSKTRCKWYNQMQVKAVDYSDISGNCILSKYPRDSLLHVISTFTGIVCGKWLHNQIWKCDFAAKLSQGSACSGFQVYVDSRVCRCSKMTRTSK